MRSALVPMSLTPTRDTLRTSIRAPWGCGRTRTATSSLKPNQNVVAVASIKPSGGCSATISIPKPRSAARASAKAASGSACKVSGATHGKASACSGAIVSASKSRVLNRPPPSDARSESTAMNVGGSSKSVETWWIGGTDRTRSNCIPK